MKPASFSVLGGICWPFRLFFTITLVAPCMSACTYTSPEASNRSHTQTHRHRHRHTDTQTYTHTHTLTHTDTHTQTHTYTHTHTFLEVFLNYKFVLLLVPASYDQVILRTDKPVELLKPSHAQRGGEEVGRRWWWVLAEEGVLTSALSLP